MRSKHSAQRRRVVHLLGGAAAVGLLPLHLQAAEVNVKDLFDAHVHIMTKDPVRYPFSEEYKTLTRDVALISPTAESLLPLLQKHGVKYAALVQHDPVYGDDNGYIADAARKNPKQLVAVGRLNAGYPNAVELMRMWVKQRGLGGFRVNGASGMGPTGMIGGVKWLEEPATMKVWDAAVELQTPLLLLLSDANRDDALAALRRVMKQQPKLQLVLDHLSDFNGKDENAPGVVPTSLLAAASIPNLYVKVSTHNFRRLALNKGSPQAAMKKLVAAFGANRIVWGSDVGNTPIDYATMVAMAKSAVSELSVTDQQLILSGTARALYRLG
ncbi:MAG: amidohydrolase family protein [Steroidobacteraceae bacterium]